MFQYVNGEQIAFDNFCCHYEHQKRPTNILCQQLKNLQRHIEWAQKNT